MELTALQAVEPVEPGREVSAALTETQGEPIEKDADLEEISLGSRPSQPGSRGQE